MNIYEKIADIQDELGNVKKDSQNPRFHNTYATYEQVIETVYPFLRKHKLMSYNELMSSTKDGHIKVITWIRDIEAEDAHQFVNSEFEIPLVKQDPQAAGSAITYAKRYSLLAMLGIGTEDDDGETHREEVKVVPVEEGSPKGMPQAKCMDCGKQMNYRTGIGKNGKPWQALFCPEKNHEPIWL